MAFFPFSGGYSDGWPSWQSSFNSPFGQSYQRPAQRYREPEYFSPYQGLGNDYYYPRQTYQPPRSSYFGGRQPSAPRNVWREPYSDDSDEEAEVGQPPCTCGMCDQNPTRRIRQPVRPQAQARRSPQKQQQRNVRPQKKQQATAARNEVKEAGPRAEKELNATQEEVVKTSGAPSSPEERATPEPTPSNPAERHEEAAAAQEAPKSPALSLKEKRLAQVKAVQDDVQTIEEEVAEFSGERGSKQYLRLEDLLTKALLRLDGVEAGDDNEVRSARRSAVHSVQRLIDLLERVGNSNDAEENHSSSEEGEEEDVEEKSEEDEGEEEEAMVTEEEQAELSAEDQEAVSADAAESLEQDSTDVQDKDDMQVVEAEVDEAGITKDLSSLRTDDVNVSDGELAEDSS